MGFFAPKKQSDPAPSGSHVGRCIHMLDLGTHEKTWKGQVSDKRIVRLTFELPTETKVFKEEDGPQPYLVGREFTFFLGKKAALRQFLEVWRGQPFTEEEANAFDISVLLDKPALLSVSHAVTESGTYANIDSAMRLPKGMICPERIQPLRMLHLDDFGSVEFSKTFAALPEWLQKKIAASREYIWASEDSQTPRSAAKAAPVDEEADDIPF